MRMRDQSRGATYGSWDEEHHWYQTNSKGTSSGSGWDSEHSDVMHDVVTPRFHERIARGEIINSPMVHAIQDHVRESGSYRFDGNAQGPGWRTVTGLISEYLLPEGIADSHYHDSLPSPVSQQEVADAIRVARSQALSRMDETPYGFMEDVAEIRSTLALTRAPVDNMKSIANAFFKRRSKFKRLKTTKDRANALNDLYLQWRYAITPAWKSVEDALALWGEHAEGTILRAQPPRLTARWGSNLTGQSSASPVVDQGWRTFNTEVRREMVCKVRAGILYTHHNPNVDWRYDTGLRAKDIPATIWAVMPYSFMIDRMSNVTSAIRGMTNLLDPNLRILAAWDSLETDDSKEYWIEKENRTDGTSTISGGHTIKRYWSKRRQPWVPTISNTVQPLHVAGLVTDISSLADVLALIHSRFRR